MPWSMSHDGCTLGFGRIWPMPGFGGALMADWLMPSFGEALLAALLLGESCLCWWLLVVCSWRPHL